MSLNLLLRRNNTTANFQNKPKETLLCQEAPSGCPLRPFQNKPKETLLCQEPPSGCPPRPPGTHSAVNVRFSPHHIVLLVDDFGPAEYVEVFHDIFLHVSQGGDLGEKSCQWRSTFSKDRQIYNWGAGPHHVSTAVSCLLSTIAHFKHCVHVREQSSKRNKINSNHRLISQSESHSLPDSLQFHGLYSPWTSPGQNTGVGSLSLLQGSFPTQESNRGLLHCRQILYQPSQQGSLYPSEESPINPLKNSFWSFLFVVV